MESSAFREAISHFATGVTVVTTVHRLSAHTAIELMFDDAELDVRPRRSGEPHWIGARYSLLDQPGCRAACSVKNAPGFCTSIWSISSWVTPASRSAGSTLFEISR
jgi:hypothetical protein